jgi:type III restriction enzyme
VDFWTSRDVREVSKSHVNLVAADTSRWEQAAAHRIDRHPAVEAFAKNAELGFAIPYVHGGRSHDYEPDFLVRFAGRPDYTLVLETKGFDPLADVKRQAAARWVAAVSEDGTYGVWAYEMVRDPAEIDDVLTRHADRDFAQTRPRCQASADAGPR